MPPKGSKTKAPSTGEQTPSVGRAVHFVDWEWQDEDNEVRHHRAATVTEVNTGNQALVHLAVLFTSHQEFKRDVMYDASGTTPGTWHWPERVD
jgi:hypothetical protein